MASMRPKFFITGSFNDWSRQEMERSENEYTSTVEVGGEGVERFMFLCNGDWNDLVTPTMEDANPDTSYHVMSHVSLATSSGLYFAIGLAAQEQGSAGIPYVVSLTIGVHGQVSGVS